MWKGLWRMFQPELDSVDGHHQGMHSALQVSSLRFTNSVQLLTTLYTPIYTHSPVIVLEYAESLDDDGVPCNDPSSPPSTTYHKMCALFILSLFLVGLLWWDYSTGFPGMRNGFPLSKASNAWWKPPDTKGGGRGGWLFFFFVSRPWRSV